MTHAKYVLMWTEAKAPSLAEMEAMAHEVFERLPKTFRTLCQGVIIRVDDFPTDEVLDEMQAQSEFDLLGLFQGIGLPHQSHGDVARLPNMIWLYRRPILDYWAEHDESLGHIDKLAARPPGVSPQHVERLAFVERVALHQDALGTFDQGAASEGSLEVLILGEASQNDVDRAL